MYDRLGEDHMHAEEETVWQHPKLLLFAAIISVCPKRVLRSLLAMLAVNRMLGSFGLDVHFNTKS